MALCACASLPVRGGSILQVCCDMLVSQKKMRELLMQLCLQNNTFDVPFVLWSAGVRELIVLYQNYRLFGEAEQAILCEDLRQCGGYARREREENLSYGWSNCCKSSALRTAVCELRARVMDVTDCDVHSTRTGYLLLHPQGATSILSRVDESSSPSDVFVSSPYVQQQHQIEEMRFCIQWGLLAPHKHLADHYPLLHVNERSSM